LVAQAQGAAAGQPRNPRITFDRNGGSFTAVLPFDQRFTLVNAAPPPLLRVTTWYSEATALRRDDCQDLSGRTRIGGAIRTEVRKLSGLTVIEQDTVMGALNTKLRGVPLEVFDTSGRRQLQQEFADTLARRPENRALLTTLSRTLSARLDSVPVLPVSKARWTRSTAAQPSDSFALDIRGLRVGRDFTFCVESVETLSGVDSTALISRIAASVRSELRKHFMDGPGTVEIDTTALRKLQRSLRTAVLPTADSIVAPAGSLLASAPPIDAIRGSFVGITSVNQSRCYFASTVNTMALTTAPPAVRDPTEERPTAEAAAAKCGAEFYVAPDQVTLGWAVRRLAGDAGLRKLAGLTAFAEWGGNADTGRSAVPVPAMAAARVALTVTSLNCRKEYPRCAEAEMIARGQTPLTNPRLPTEGNANIHLRTASAEVRPWADNLDSTIVRLRELREFVSQVARDRATQRRLGLTVAELDTTLTRIQETRTAAERQRSNVRSVIEQIDAMDRAVLAVASGVVGRDLTLAGIATTSSASYETRARWHVGQDIGVLHAFRGKDTRETAPYLGVSIYLRPVNKRGDLAPVCPLDLRCTAFNIGVTTSKFEETGRYSGVLGGIPLVVGIGTRLGSFVRVSYNVPLVYTYRFDPDGTAHRRLDRLNSVALTLDADIREILGALGTSLFGK
jgi:hypothetical protein